MMTVATVQSGDFIDAADARRVAVGAMLDGTRQKRHEQYFTPAAVARLMASMIQSCQADVLSLLDPGAGTGILSAALVEAILAWPQPPQRIDIVAYEIDRALHPHLGDTLALCARTCAERGVVLTYAIRGEDYIAAAADMLDGRLFGRQADVFDLCIMNPPYGKIHSSSPERAHMRRLGVETSNLYTAFLALAARLLAPAGQLVSITPRSFCNGSYFQAFRRDFLGLMTPDRTHVFGRRDRAFKADNVLQETIIMHAIKTGERPGRVTISSSVSIDDPPREHDIPYARLVRPDDREMVMHLIEDADGADIAARMDALPCTLGVLGLDVSTGPVVDFRATEYLRAVAGSDMVPLLWPEHCRDGRVVWPRDGSNKPQAIVPGGGIARHMVPTGRYVLVKRFSAKEERRRVVAVVLDGRALSDSVLGVENHLNVIHAGGRGLTPSLARGLALFLNSTVVDRHFRQFSGHTQVNATDLRRMRYPSRAQLDTLGAAVGDVMPTQAEIDEIVERTIQ